MARRKAARVADGDVARVAKRKAVRAPLLMAGKEIAPGTRHELHLSQSNLPSAQELPMRVVVLHGRRKGPGLWISAAIHGDEIGGVEVIRRVLHRIDPEQLRGTLYAIPIVNTFGFLQKTRTLPDGRDLNRTFPGSAGGSLASRLAHLFMTEIVDRCDYGIDLHTAGLGRDNLPQIRADLDDELVASAARAFGAPVMMHSKVRDGSLRASAAARGRPTLLYEGGAPLCFDEAAIATAERGVLNVMALLRMGGGARLRRTAPPHELRSSTWIRSPRAGVARITARMGDEVAYHDVIGTVAGPLGDKARKLRAPSDGIIIGLATNPIVYQGDGLIHLGRTRPRPKT